MVCHPEELLLFLCHASEALPSTNVKEVVISATDSTGDGIISRDDVEWFGGHLPILPLHHDVERGAFAIGMIGVEGAFMSHDALELPKDFLTLFFGEVIHDLMTGQEFFTSIIVERNLKF